LLGNRPGKQIIVEVDDVEIGAICELRGDIPFQTVGREVENGEVDEGQELRRDWTGEGVGREVKSLEIGTVGEEWGYGAPEREVVERELVNAAIVADGTLENGGGIVAGLGIVLFLPVMGQAGGILQGPAEVRETCLVAWI